jgi:hypothetical protein
VLSSACPVLALLARSPNSPPEASIPTHLLSWQVPLAKGKPLPPLPSSGYKRRRWQGQLRTGEGTGGRRRRPQSFPECWGRGTRSQKGKGLPKVTQPASRTKKSQYPRARQP